MAQREGGKGESLMDRFFSEAGEFVRHEVREEGEVPRRRFVAVFFHEKGKASFRFDGGWGFEIEAKGEQRK